MISRDRDRRVALAIGLGVLALAGLIVGSWDGLHAWYVGYRFIWLPEGAVPTRLGQPINACGEVAVDLSQGRDITWAGRWSLATGEVLLLDVPLAGGESSMVSAINDAGDMAGTVTGDAGLWGNHVTRPFLWTKGAGAKDLGTLGGEQAIATAINWRGQVVGECSSQWKSNRRACLWSAESGIVELGSLAPGKSSAANAINEAGWVVGGATAANGSFHPFLWKPETGMQDLGLPSGFSGGEAYCINNQGEILVRFYKMGTSGSRKDTFLYTPFVWRERDDLVKLPAPPGFDNVVGVALNNRGMVLLEARPSDPSLQFIGYLIMNGVLKELPAASGAKSTRYYGLNDKGWVVGEARMKDESASRRGFAALPMR